MSVLTFEKALARFYENLSCSPDEEYYHNPVGLERKQRIVTFIKGIMPRRVLDVGCGDGNISRELLEIVDITGVDIAPKRVSRACTLGIKVVCADVLRLPFVKGSFDCAICSEVIEHVIYPEQLLAEIRHVLGPGGMLVLTVPLEKQGSYNSLRDIPLEDLAKLDYAVLKQRYHVKNDHLTFFTEDKIMSMLQFGGFVVVAKEYTYDYEPRSVVHSIMVSILHRLPFGAVHNLTRIFYKKTKQVHHLVVKATLDKEQKTVT